MSVMTNIALTVFAPTEADGTLRGANMGEAQIWGTEIEYLANLAYTSSLVYSTRAALYANLVPGANTPALVIGDPTAGYDGLYMKVGATTTGSWTRLGDVPGYSFIKATDAGAGTANAIIATSTPIPSADGGALIALNIFETNTAAPVTVAFNGGSALTIKTNAGNDVAVGGLTAGMIVAGYVSGSTFRLLSDQSSAAIVAAAEAAQAAAEAAQVAAEAAAASVVASKYNSQATAAAATISALTDFIEVGGLVYQRISATHPRLGPELITTGDFSATGAWTESGDTAVWSIGSGVATSVAGGAAFLLQTTTLANGEKIFTQFDIATATAGGARAVLGGSNTLGAVHSTTGTKTDVLTATGASISIGLYSPGTGGFSGTIDNYSAKKLPADAFVSADGAWWAQPFLGARQLDFVSMFGGVADGTDSLDAGVTTTVRGAWVTSTAYALHDLVWSGGLGYRCIVAHTSGTFATDLSAAKWVVGAFSGTDNLAALKRMVIAHEATGLPMYIPYGKYRVVLSGSANAQMISLTGRRFVLKGEGELLLDDPLTASSAFNLFGTSDYPSAGTTYSRRTKERFEIDGITFRGRWSHKPERDRVDILETAGYDAFVIKNCKFYDIPGQISWDKLSESVWFANNICERIGAGALRSQDSHNRFVLNNRIRWTGDDSIDMHDRVANGIARGLTIMGNHLKQCEGIIALGCFAGTITGNTLEIPHGTGIVIGTGVSVEGDNASVNLSVQGNTVLDSISASADGSTLADTTGFAAGILVGSRAASLVSGDYDGSTKTNDPIVDNDFYNDTSASNPVPNGGNITVAGNAVKRTRPSGGAYSAWGEGLYFYKDGWIDPTVDAAKFRSNGITIQSDVRNVAVNGNAIAGFRSGAGCYLYFTATGDALDFAFQGFVFAGNAVEDCLRGVSSSIGFSAVTDRYCQGIISGNIFNLDPYHVSAARAAANTGKWSSGATDAQKVWGVVLANIVGMAVHNNVFANLYDPFYADTALTNCDYLNNIVHCEPIAEIFDVDNRGVAIPRAGGQEVCHVIVDCNPASATFNQVINHCIKSAASIPTTGTYVKGHRVLSKTPGTSSSKTLLGWVRQSTGSGHTAATTTTADWAPFYAGTS
ncbi:MAG: right-handed parallel beta-helix repeat-containing protein [Pseudomonadota bacterium]